MSLDGGGWTLVWKNSFMDNLPLSDNMRYYSGYYKPCTGISDRGWCNIPKKADKFSPKEQMIVAYHKTHVVYAYKGLFNRNIDYDWSGGILLDFKKIVDKCTQKMVFSQLLKLTTTQFLALDLINIHHITTMLTIVIRSGGQ